MIVEFFSQPDSLQFYVRCNRSNGVSNWGLAALTPDFRRLSDFRFISAGRQGGLQIGHGGGGGSKSWSQLLL